MSEENSEETVWKGGPSQVVNYPTFLACFLVAVMFITIGAGTNFWPLYLGVIIPVIAAGWKFLVVRCQGYEITTQRLRIFEGVLNRDIDEIELYRVKDSRLLLPFWLRVFGLGNIALETSDRTHPSPVLLAVKDAQEVREQLRKHVEILRDQKRVREVDFDETGDSEFGDELG